MNEKRSHVNGAVYKWKGVPFFKPKNAPLIVVAFRGTSLDSQATSSDMAVNIRIISNKLHETSRFEAALVVVKRMIAAYRLNNICIVGHSLGAALGLLIGRRMAEEGCYLETHLFNPPFASLPLEMALGSNAFSRQLRLLHILVTSALAFLLKDLESGRQVSESLKPLDDWFPDLYVNANDVICSPYLDYFSVNKHLMIPFEGALAPYAKPFSLRGLLLSMYRTDFTPHHLIPSARLHVSYMRFDGALEAHYLSSWWSTRTAVSTIVARSGKIQVSNVAASIFRNLGS
ncbi:hypothetical protein O6H91_17G046000 [Diphasiastrum complanatum]|nr:hypothetical protein O6H91_17G046000 [Diphasiastrum complanatum]